MRFLVFMLLLSFLSCEKSVHSDKDYTDCIYDKVEEFKEEMNQTCAGGSSVKVYKFQSINVFVFERGNCFNDYGIEVYNEDCEIICTLGTLLGITKCQGEEFATAEEIDVLWKG